MSAPATGVAMLLRWLKLPGFVYAYAETAGQAECEGWGFERYLDQLAEIEARCRRRIDRLLGASHLPHDKTLSALDLDRLPTQVRGPQPRCHGS